MLCHPFSAGEVRVKRASCPIMLKLRINMQYELRHLAPICPFRVRIENSQIRYNMFLVVCREDGIRRRNVGNVGILRGRLHDTVRAIVLTNSNMEPPPSKGGQD